MVAMIKKKLQGVAELLDLKQKEALLYLALSAAGWLYFGYEYLYDSGLGVAVPKYAGY